MSEDAAVNPILWSPSKKRIKTSESVPKNQDVIRRLKTKKNIRAI